MRKIFILFFALASVSFASCQKTPEMPDYGSPEGKYWFSYSYDLTGFDLIDLGATRPGKAYNLYGANAEAAYKGEQIEVGDNCNPFTIRKDKLNQYTVLVDGPNVTLVIRMLAEDVARIDFFYTSSGAIYRSIVYSAINANIHYIQPPEL